MTVLTIVRLTLLEAARRRLLWALVVLTAAVAVLTGWGFDLLVKAVRAEGASASEVTLFVSQLVILVAFMFSFVLTMTAAFLGAPAIGAQLESGVALAMLARPLRRSSYLLGTWLGLAVVLVAYAVGSGILELAVVRLVTGYWPPDAGGALAFLAAEALVLLTLALVLGTSLPSLAAGAVAVVVYGLTWVAGILGAFGIVFDAPALVAAADASRAIVPLDGLWRGVVWSLEPGEMLLLGAARDPAFQANPFFAGQPPEPLFVAWAVAWVGLVLVLGIVRFERREQ